MHDRSPEPPSIAVIMPAAGSGQRFGGQRNKLFSLLAGKPLWFRSAERLASQPQVGRILMPISYDDRAAFEGEFAPLVAELNIELVDGGAERSDSVRAGIAAIGDDQTVGWIAVHDAARPLVSNADLASVFAMAGQTGAAILASPVPGTIKREINISGKASRTQTVDRRDLYVALTPQVFAAGLLKQAYEKHNGRPATDDAELVERIGHGVSIVRGSADNLKITYPEDLLVAEAIWSRQTNTHHA